MKLSINYCLSLIMISMISIIAVCFFGENEAVYQAQQQLHNASVRLQNADFSETSIQQINDMKGLHVHKESAYMYRVEATYDYKIPILLFHDERVMYQQLYKGGW